MSSARTRRRISFRPRFEAMESRALMSGMVPAKPLELRSIGPLAAPSVGTLPVGRPQLRALPAASQEAERVALAAPKVGKKTIVYSATETTIVPLVDSQLRYMGTYKFTHSASVIVGPPLRSTRGHYREANPFDLIITGAPAGGNGDVTLRSAALFQGRYWMSPLGLQYWNLGLSRARRSFSGSLVNDHLQDAAPANLLYYPKNFAGLWLTLPGTIDPGATITGQFSGNHLSITLRGITNDRLHPFITTIEGVTSRAPKF